MGCPVSPRSTAIADASARVRQAHRHPVKITATQPAQPSARQLLAGTAWDTLQATLAVLRLHVRQIGDGAAAQAIAAVQDFAQQVEAQR
jgi:hypothetical protein